MEDGGGDSALKYCLFSGFVLLAYAQLLYSLLLSPL